MKEIEVKILEVNPGKIRNELEQLGAKKIFTGDIQAIHFDYPDFRLKKGGRILRVRKKGDKVELTYKEKIHSSQFKIAEETEVITSDFATTCKIFENLGLQKVYKLEKYRESYSLEDVHFDLDIPKLSFIPPLLEIEADSEQKVKYFLQKLGFTMEQASTMNAREVEEYYQKKNGKN